MSNISTEKPIPQKPSIITSSEIVQEIGQIIEDSPQQRIKRLGLENYYHGEFRLEVLNYIGLLPREQIDKLAELADSIRKEGKVAALTGDYKNYKVQDISPGDIDKAIRQENYIAGVMAELSPQKRLESLGIDPKAHPELIELAARLNYNDLLTMQAFASSVQDMAKDKIISDFRGGKTLGEIKTVAFSEGFYAFNMINYKSTISNALMKAVNYANIQKVKNNFAEESHKTQEERLKFLGIDVSVVPADERVNLLQDVSKLTPDELQQAKYFAKETHDIGIKIARISDPITRDDWKSGIDSEVFRNRFANNNITTRLLAAIESANMDRAEKEGQRNVKTVVSDLGTLKTRIHSEPLQEMVEECGTALGHSISVIAEHEDGNVIPSHSFDLRFDPISYSFDKPY